ncbi:hypothetical protein DUNSADRAFT_17145 [Dunaliella salina]|uniref:FCP1 homology domain-containing protein n=1 Tax=Dunaliella salina TaxID=3046 RepID=A0ABQ7G2B2_DUNSA|nr:hypothetical protein DUNSADRAFT_17145 [Dunaliella salina]|eukprot:KAF5828734.1 hypothetical protein DUNSADRAFT_17145 [Dunaliella salina]
MHQLNSWQGQAGWQAQQGSPAWELPNMPWPGSSPETWQGHPPFAHQQAFTGPPLHHAMPQPFPLYPPHGQQHHWEQPAMQGGRHGQSCGRGQPHGRGQPYGRGQPFRGRGRGNPVVAALIATYADPYAKTKYDECDPQVVEGLWGFPEPAGSAAASGAAASSKAGTAGTAAATQTKPSTPAAHPAQGGQGHDAGAAHPPSNKATLQGDGMLVPEAAATAAAAHPLSNKPRLQGDGVPVVAGAEAPAERLQPGTDAGLDGTQQLQQVQQGVQQEEVQQREQQDRQQQQHIRPEQDGETNEGNRKRRRDGVQEHEVHEEQQQQQQQQQHEEQQQQQLARGEQPQQQQQRTEAELEAYRARRSLPILLFDLNGTLTSHTSQRNAAGTNYPRPHVALLARLAKKFR